MIKSILLLFLLFSSTEAMAALSYTHLDSGDGAPGVTTQTTNSITVAANELVIIVVSGFHNGGGVTVSVSSVVYNGTSTSLTAITSQQYNEKVGPANWPFVVAAYYFIPSGASSGTITITYNQFVTDASWSTFYFTGENTTTPIAQSVPVDSCSGATTCSTLTPSLASAITANDATVAAYSTRTQTVTATAGYTTIDNISTDQDQLTEYKITGTQSPAATWSATNAGALAFEVGVGPSGSISKVSGITDASIAKISGVADASINKIAGVSGP